MSSVSAPDFGTAPAIVAVLRRPITRKSISTTKHMDLASNDLGSSWLDVVLLRFQVKTEKAVIATATTPSQQSSSECLPFSIGRRLYSGIAEVPFPVERGSDFLICALSCVRVQLEIKATVLPPPTELPTRPRLRLMEGRSPEF